MSAAGPAPAEADSTVLLAQRPARRKYAFSIVLAVASQLGWGLYPVFARALQTQEPVLSLLELMLMLNVLSVAEQGLLLGAIYAARRIVPCWRPAHSRSTSGGASTVSLKLVAVVIGFALVIAIRATTNLASAAYAPAHWCVMINLCTPVWTAAIGRLLFREPLPPFTIAALVVGLGGSALAIFGGVHAHGDDIHVASERNAAAAAGATELLVLGVGLAFVSSMGLAVYQHVVRRTKGMLSEQFVLILNYLVVLVPALSLLLAAQASGTEDLLVSLTALGPRQWILLLLFSSLVYLGANLAQQMAIRELGPTIVAAAMPLRLLSSVAGSYTLLDEGLTSPTEAAGLLTVAISTGAYLWRQVALSRRLRPPARSAVELKGVPAVAGPATPATPAALVTGTRG